ncbi:TIGR02679 domain-containing protein [Streptomyces avermitilis]|uniref:TIGR02679 domain-containing protein n=1 Tax=Streptomyces avermitilis TaxID=33903 RepID=UPI0033BB54E2
MRVHDRERRYGALVDLLIQLCRPQLSKRPSEAALSRALTESLPPMDQAVIADAPEAFRSLDEEKEELRAAREAQEAASAFLDHYRRYARIAARRGTVPLRCPRGGRGKTAGPLVLSGIRALRDFPEGAGAEWQRAAWASGGLLRDDVSSTVPTLNLRGTPALDWMADRGEPAVLTLRSLTRHDPSGITTATGTVYVSGRARRVGPRSSGVRARCTPRCASGMCSGGRGSVVGSTSPVGPPTARIAFVLPPITDSLST